ncbi:Mitochondrial ribosome small subunit biogenesis protein [Friedmanniomyces endolithicus]|uniref:Mitochondrial ribosome small subunit biogenesis protein n=1 Tax=Friedmanniomyces endolithicus TaxID=329885 RepID=A0AAN6FJN9_9PEZI|nr:Mitochondrial ribosome small subunit biogenesis protein [Friedmanniomyces endolithicus]KAK0296275.1 Mitochondrial ribosome small subunit biogenesis protein [Friedmanniomyces endolithicus]KAK0319670.1 Mitochondrial ribosome small subunit biogenesis protein [Friedmanniomyces endolithicus]KAK1004964.1 Mitochondrial ribosome small subunit biogenesis protein [Friedmanniomyces endolithicus]
MFRRLPLAIRLRELHDASCTATRCDRLRLPGSDSSPAPRHQLARWFEPSRRLFASQTTRREELVASTLSEHHHLLPPPTGQEAETTRALTKRLPVVCPGCGAHSQTNEPSSAGYYDLHKARNSKKRLKVEQEDAVWRQALAQDSSLLMPDRDAFSSAEPQHTPEPSSTIVPICDRCHSLLYQSHGTSIIHPSMQSIQSIIEESPHKHNHIYHVLDAADFPLSLIPNLQHALNLPKLRTRNRRSKTIQYTRGRVAEVSFIITRSDLLAPKKEQVDTLMPYLQGVLRDALGRRDAKVRLGNVRCVSSKRGWWTKVVKEEVWERRGAAWMVGKVNVGKSALFEVVFPKGRMGQDKGDGAKREGSPVLETGLSDTAGGEDVLSSGSMETANSASDLAEGEGKAESVATKTETYQESELLVDREILDDADGEPFNDYDDDLSLLPPAQPETAFPTMPLVSSLPGTTASPIRIPYGNGKGELIDLPGVHRSSLDLHVLPEDHKEMVMKSRITPEQVTIRPGQSLLLGGLIRLTPKFSREGEVMLAYPFVPAAFTPHVTGTHKAIAIQTGVHSQLSRDRLGDIYEGKISSIATEDAKARMLSAGKYKLEWNVTKRRSGALTQPAAGKQKADELPFTIYSADMLVESVGWVELVCQVRKRRQSLPSDDALSALEDEPEGAEDGMPEVEVWSPEGKYVGWRRPMGAWDFGGKRREAVHLRRGRPRGSIGGRERRKVN